ncbi:DUF3823 domain-containing protein [Mucilaginibacter limnophilus]|uniref:DUF3823 domain-containing protein n=1 Tax=Mucilaginibacter limnophilus TaxID=1932778 RepID=A0A3S2ULB2_9SPHI|nr:DUF3823 domain-containing protein [Mucilaginibacter limnophilus]RVU01021.1 DUF3823 domain-containing protein [Mucilaginibacter limnophilus]
MKRNRIYIAIILLATVVLGSCNKVDDYAEPEETLTGKIIDVETGEPLYTEQPDGTRIKLLQTDWNDNPLPQYFWVKPDGTFRNTKIFKGKYEVTPVDGPFVPLTEPQTIDLAGEKDLTFKVLPFLRVKLGDVSVNGTTVIVNYTIARPAGAGTFKITDAKVFVSTTSQATNASFDNKLTQTNNLQGTADDEILGTNYTASITLPEKRSFYIRVGARSEDNVSRRYNYTEAVKVDIP